MNMIPNRWTGEPANSCSSEAHPAAPAMTIKVARTMEEMLQAFAVRAAVFMSEEGYSYAEEFDGNDFSATQIVGLVGNEPATTLRVRYFADFAKPERLATRREFRKTGITGEIIHFAKELCRRKGYTKLHGHAQAHLLPFWERHGFHPIGTPGFIHGTYEYFEIECDLPPHADSITFDDDPLLIIDPEGAWRAAPARAPLHLTGEPAGHAAPLRTWHRKAVVG